MRTLPLLLLLVLVVKLLLAVPGGAARADLFTCRDDQGNSVEIEARLVAEAGGALVLELADGEYRLISQAAVEKREPRDGPEPLDCQAVAKRLEERFGAERFRSFVREPFVMGLVLTAPLERSREARARNLLQRAAGFMKNVETAFGSFAKEARLPARPPTHPLVVLIFETDADFEKHTERVTGGTLAAAGVAGFYSALTNQLAIRLAECRTFDVPLHEAIHQQVYNRNVFHRLSPVPHWFDEGLATGFEANQGKINIGPTKISPRYARQVLAARELSFSDVMENDRVFSGDVLVGEAYGRAWGLHWLLVTRYRSEYAKYVRLLASKEPLAKEDAARRHADFREAFGKDLAQVEREFRPYLDNGIKRQKVVLNPERPPGISLTHENLGKVELTAVNRLDVDGRLEVQGTLTNNSPIRAMAFRVTVETDSGTYADWVVPSLEVQKSVSLPKQYAAKVRRGAPGGLAGTFRVRIESALPESPELREWQNASAGGGSE